ncbi:hypothetical protein U1Q18_001642 [Sarracenia purpurea var. burkii]
MMAGKAMFSVGFRLGYLGAGLVFTMFDSSLYTVEGGNRAVIFDRYHGVINETVGEGSHFVIPWLQWPNFFNIRSNPYTSTTIAHSKDLQEVRVIIRVLSHPDVTQLPRIYKMLGPMYEQKVLPSIGNEALKAAVDEFTADELYFPRVTSLIREKLIPRAKNFDIIIDDVAIIHLSYGSELSDAVERTQVAKQEVERSKLLIDKAEQEARATIAWAEGESQCSKLISDATLASVMAWIELKRIEALKEISVILSKNPNIIYIPKKSSVSLEVKVDE